MMPANRILKAGCAGWAGWAGWVGRESPSCRSCLSCPSSPHRSSFCRLNQLVDRFGIVQRLADRQPRAHPSIEIAALEELFVAPLRRDAAAVEDENAVGVADGRQAMRDHDRRA